MKFTTLGFLTFTLWSTFVLFLLAIPARFVGDENARYSQRSPMNIDDPETRYIHKLARETAQPVHLYLLVGSAGCLAIMRTIRVAGSILLDALAAKPAPLTSPRYMPPPRTSELDPFADEPLKPVPVTQVMHPLSRSIVAPETVQPVVESAADIQRAALRRAMNGGAKP